MVKGLNRSNTHDAEKEKDKVIRTTTANRFSRKGHKARWQGMGTRFCEDTRISNFRGHMKWLDAARRGAEN